MRAFDPKQANLEQAIQDALNHAIAYGDIRSAVDLAAVFRTVIRRHQPLAC